MLDLLCDVDLLGFYLLDASDPLAAVPCGAGCAELRQLFLEEEKLAAGMAMTDPTYADVAFPWNTYAPTLGIQSDISVVERLYEKPRAD